MATVKGVYQTKADNGGLSNQYGAGLRDGRIKVAYDYYTLAGTEASGTIFELGGELPAGANIIAIMVSATVAQSSLTFKLGTTYNDDEFVAAGDTTLQTAGLMKVAPGKAYVVGTADTDNQVVLTTGGATATAGELDCAILYTTD